RPAGGRADPRRRGPARRAGRPQTPPADRPGAQDGRPVAAARGGAGRSAGGHGSRAPGRGRAGFPLTFRPAAPGRAREVELAGESDRRPPRLFPFWEGIAMARGRRPGWAEAVERLEGSAAAKARLRAVLEALTGGRTLSAVCLQQGISER